jgi:hypothetical protein
VEPFERGDRRSPRFHSEAPPVADNRPTMTPTRRTMKLGEALTLRADVQNRIQQLRGRLQASALAQEGENPPEDPAGLLREFAELADQLEELVLRINRTNIQTRLADGRSLTEALARRDSLALRHGVVREVADTAGERQQRYGRAEIRTLPTVEVATLRHQTDELARERRELDALIQETNWLTELVE